MNEEEYSIERLRAVVSRMRKYRRRALIYACATAALAIIAAIAKPYLYAYSNRIFAAWPQALYGYLLIPFILIAGTLCVMSAASALADITIKVKWLRYTLLAIGIVLLAYYIYSISELLIFLLLGLQGFYSWPWICNYIGKYPVLFAVPVCLIYLGAVKPADKIRETE